MAHDTGAGATNDAATAVGALPIAAAAAPAISKLLLLLLLLLLCCCCFRCAC
jgi:hypothetical protein